MLAFLYMRPQVCLSSHPSKLSKFCLQYRPASKLLCDKKKKSTQYHHILVGETKLKWLPLSDLYISFANFFCPANGQIDISRCL